MNTDLIDVLDIGIPMILIGLIALTLMVHREFGPFSGLGSGGKWLLTGAFGMGILAFTLKMAVAFAVTRMPESTIAPLLAASGMPSNPDGESDYSSFNNLAAPTGRYVWQALPEHAPEPADNPSTPEKIALGKRLFFETRLSGDGRLSCSSCHNLMEKAGGDGLPTAKGINAQIGERNTPTVWNAAFQSVLFWDGRARSLEEQAGGPILNPVEMGLASATEAERRISADATYRTAFAKAFGDKRVSFQRITQAIAAYERTLITPDAPFDRFVRGDSSALNQAQIRGMTLFESTGCILCHRGPNFSDASLLGGQSPKRIFPANATPYEKKYKLLTEGNVRGSWRVASLRNVALTGPWLHNGSVDKLEEVVRIMASAQLGRSGNFMAWLNQDSALGKLDRTPLGDQVIADIVAFLKSLSSERLLAGRADTGP